MNVSNQSPYRTETGRKLRKSQRRTVRLMLEMHAKAVKKMRRTWERL